MSDTLASLVEGAARAASASSGEAVRMWRPGRAAKPPAVQWRVEGVNPDGRRLIRITVWWAPSDPTSQDLDLAAYVTALSDLLRLQLISPTAWTPLRNQQVVGLRTAGQTAKGVLLDGWTSVWTEP